MGKLFRRIRYLMNWRRLDAELAEEMEFHREMAARAGRNNFGNTLRLREQAFEAWGWTWLDRLLQDLRYGVRMWARAPGFTLMAVLVLAIGIGVNVSAFSFFDMVALKPLPVPESDRLVRLERRSPNNYTSEMAYPSFLFYREHAKTLSATLAILGVPPLQIDAINNRRPAPPSSVSRMGLTSPTMISVSGTTLAVRLRPVTPYCRWSCIAIAAISASAAFMVTPSRSLPIPQKL